MTLNGAGAVSNDHISEPAGTLVRSDALLAFYEKRLSNQQQSPTVLLKSLSNRPGCR